MLIRPKHLVDVRVAYSVVFYIVFRVQLFVCLSISVLGITISVYVRFMRLNVPLIYVAPLLYLLRLTVSRNFFKVLFYVVANGYG